MLLPHVVCHDKERRFLEQQHLKYLNVKELSGTTTPKVSDFKVELSGTPTPKVSVQILVILRNFDKCAHVIQTQNML